MNQSSIIYRLNLTLKKSGLDEHLNVVDFVGEGLVNELCAFQTEDEKACLEKQIQLMKLKLNNQYYRYTNEYNKVLLCYIEGIELVTYTTTFKKII